MQGWMITCGIFFIVQFAAFVWWMSRTTTILERVEKAFEKLEKRWDTEVSSIWKRIDDLRKELDAVKAKVQELQ